MRPKTSRAILLQADAPVFLVTDRANVRYLTSLALSAGCLLVTPRRSILFTDGRYLEVAMQRAPEGMAVEDARSLERVLAKISLCGFEADAVRVSELLQWKRKFKNTKFVHKEGVIEEFRRSKDEEELRLFRRAQRITRELLRRVPSALRSGMTERKLAWQLRAWAQELGADELAFDPIVAFGTHTSRPHHRPTDRRLQRGHIVQVDVGARYRGYCADQSAVFFTGKPTPLQGRVYAAVLEAKEQAMAAVRPGVTNHALDRIAREVLRRHGFEQYFSHSLGHGVGLEIHEGISLSQKAPENTLLKNEIITIEPGVYLPGRFGVRLEEEVIVL